MKVAFYERTLDKVPRQVDLSWPELVALLMKFRESATCAAPPGKKCPGAVARSPDDPFCPEKDGRLWSPVEISKWQRKENVREVTAAVFDLDRLSSDPRPLLEAIEAAGYSYVVHSTHQHNPPESWCIRIVMPVSRPVKPGEWERVWEAATQKFGLKADASVKDPCRAFYLPNFVTGRPRIARYVEGEPLDVDELLRTAPAPPVAPTPSVAVEPIPIDMTGLRAELLRLAKPENRAMIRQHLAGEGLPNTEGEEGHDKRTLRLMASCAYLLPEETPEEAILELFDGCFRATVCDKGYEHHREEARAKLRRKRAEAQQFYAARLESNRKVFETLRIAHQPKPTPTEEGDPEDPDAWYGRLIAKDNRVIEELGADEEYALKICEANLYAILRYSPEWRGVLRTNAVTKKIECDGSPIGPGVNPERLDVEIAVWFQQSAWGRLGLLPKPAMVRDLIPTIADANAYDPLRDQLESLSWDGVPRVETFLETYYGATGDSAYLRMVSKKWLISAAARGLMPGEKVDTVLILEGKQGKNKSTSLKVLGAPWFTDQSIDLHSKDSWALCSQYWMMEFPEGDVFKKASTWELLKAFTTRTRDTYRAPYERVNKEAPRRCVFVVTTNLHEYLRHDPSGYRRFWPVACGDIDIDALRRDRDQIWAEAVALCKAGEKWWLTTDTEKALAEAQAEERSEESSAPVEAVADWLFSRAPDARREITTYQVAIGALELQPGQVNQAHLMRAGEALRALGYTKTRRERAGARFWAYVAPEAILAEPMRARGLLKTIHSAIPNMRPA